MFARELCELMASDKTTIDETVFYIRLETIASTLSILVKFITIVFITIKKVKYLYFLLCVQTIQTIVLDTFLFSKLSFSADIGINGIAISNIVTQFVLLILAIFFLYKENIDIFKRKSYRSLG